MSYSDNIDEVLAADLYQPAARGNFLGSHTLTMRNTAEHAPYLQDRHGYYVFNPEHAADTVRQWLEEVRDAGIPFTNATITQALDGAGYDETNFLLSFTGRMRPPVKAGEGPRKARQGGWSDVTGTLSNSFSHRVTGGPWKQAHGDE